MKSFKKLVFHTLFIIATLPLFAFADVQTIVPSKTNITVLPGSTIEFDVLYPDTNSESSTGLGVKMYFDSSKLNFKGVTQAFSGDLVNVTKQPLADTEDEDGNSATDSIIIAAWTSFGQTPAWPGIGNLPAILYHATFTTDYSFPLETVINFTGDVAANNSFASTPVRISFVLTGNNSTPTPPEPTNTAIPTSPEPTNTTTPTPQELTNATTPTPTPQEPTKPQEPTNTTSSISQELSNTTTTTTTTQEPSNTTTSSGSITSASDNASGGGGAKRTPRKAGVARHGRMAAWNQNPLWGLKSAVDFVLRSVL